MYEGRAEIAKGPKVYRLRLRRTDKGSVGSGLLVNLILDSDHLFMDGDTFNFSHRMMAHFGLPRDLVT